MGTTSGSTTQPMPTIWNVPTVGVASGGTFCVPVATVAELPATVTEPATPATPLKKAPVVAPTPSVQDGVPPPTAVTVTGNVWFVPGAPTAPVEANDTAVGLGTRSRNNRAPNTASVAP